MHIDIVNRGRQFLAASLRDNKFTIHIEGLVLGSVDMLNCIGKTDPMYLPFLNCGGREGLRRLRL